MIKFGITEAGDAGLDYSWANKLLDGNIIITKHLTAKNNKLIELLLKNKNKIILHVTCTGYGGTKMEPNVPKPQEVYNGVNELISRGFPEKQIVLRTDPIIPTEAGLKRVAWVWELFFDTNIDRVRYSVIDMYPHTKERIRKVFGRVPFETFKAPEAMMSDVRAMVERYSNLYDFEACAEDLPGKIGCISEKDYKILGIDVLGLKRGGYQRNGCLCCAGKTELLNTKKRCSSGCLYCYWKD